MRNRSIVNKHIGWVVVMALVLCSKTAMGAVIHVPGDQPTIQNGINAASDGDTVLVADGTYTGSGNKNLDFQGKAICLRSENGAANCIINCQGDGRGFYFHTQESTTSVVDGFTITNGNAPSAPVMLCSGGGIYCLNSSPTIINCMVTNNFAQDSGGGIYFVYSSPKIANCTVSLNRALGHGGGISGDSCSPTITDCLVTGNQSGSFGGGVNISDAPSAIISDCTITSNVSAWGGGINCYARSSTISNCTITGNYANQFSGGGIMLSSYGSYMATITNCIFSNNSAKEDGGGIYLEFGSVVMSSCIIANNISQAVDPDIDHYPSREGGGGILAFHADNVTLTNCTVSNNESYNQGGAIHCYESDCSIANCILRHNLAPRGHEISVEHSSSITIDYSNVEGGTADMYVCSSCSLIWGTGNMDADPLFVGGGDYHLTPESPCIDVGNNGVFGLSGVDFEGDPRIVDGSGDGTKTVDMGADEFVDPDIFGAYFSCYPTTGVKPLTVQCTDQSTGSVTDWSWDFGDGQTSTQQSPSHEYVAGGNYTVSLTVTGSGGEDTATKTDYIYVAEDALKADFIANPTSGGRPLTVQFTDQSTGPIDSWHWDFGLLTVGSSEQNPLVTFPYTGDYTITLSVTGPLGTDTKARVAYIHVDPTCECELIPVDIPTVIPRGGTVGFQATVTNNSDLTGWVAFATDLRLPGGMIYPASGWLNGPFWVHLNPCESASGHLSLLIPSYAPLGTYTYKGHVGLLGPQPEHWDTCQFEFEVVEP